MIPIQASQLGDWRPRDKDGCVVHARDRGIDLWWFFPSVSAEKVHETPEMKRIFGCCWWAADNVKKDEKISDELLRSSPF